MKLTRNILILFFLILVLKVSAQMDTSNISLLSSDIMSIEMKKVNPKSKQLQRELLLTEKQIYDFVLRWNTSLPDTSAKATPEYFMMVNFKNKSTKIFAIDRDKIDDGLGNYLGSPGNEEFFNKLWKALLE